MLAITVHETKTKEDTLHHVTAVVLVGPNGQALITGALYDQGFTGGLMVPYKIAEDTGLEMTPIKEGAEFYRTATGELEKKIMQIHVKDIMLPQLSTIRKFDVDVQIVPKGIGERGYGMFIRQIVMRKYGIDTSMRTDTISWGEHITVGMVPRG